MIICIYIVALIKKKISLVGKRSETKNLKHVLRVNTERISIELYRFHVYGIHMYKQFL